MAQLVKNPPEMWEMWVRFLDQEDPQGEVMATHFSILVWEFYGQSSLEGYSQSMGSQSQTRLSD